MHWHVDSMVPSDRARDWLTGTQEHVVQWHPTILSKLALVPQRTFAAYSKAELGDAYQKGDFVVMLPDCKQTGPQSCEAESKQYLSS